MKVVLGIITALAVNSSVAMAAPNKSYGHNGDKGSPVSASERVAIARSETRLATGLEPSVGAMFL
jgi:hypothetical protein